MLKVVRRTWILLAQSLKSFRIKQTNIIREHLFYSALLFLALQDLANKANVASIRVRSAPSKLGSSHRRIAPSLDNCEQQHASAIILSEARVLGLVTLRPLAVWSGANSSTGIGT